MAERGRRAVIGCIAFASLGGACEAAALPWEVWSSPLRLASLEGDDIVVTHSSRCPDGCRYDRSLRGPESGQVNPFPLRWLYRDGDEAVLFEERGPGALTRLWMTTGDGISRCIDPAIRVRFRFDGEAVPSIDLPLASLFDGSTPPFTPPLVADRLASSGGYTMHVPMPYAQSLRVSLLGAETPSTVCDPSGWGLLWYQFTAHRLRAGTPVTSFPASPDAAAWRDFLGHAGDDPWHGMLAPRSFSGVLAAGETRVLVDHAGEGVLRGLRLDIAAASHADVALRIDIDGTTMVDLPLEAFFATWSDAPLLARNALFGEDAGGRLYSWWPMPYTQSLRVALVAAASRPPPGTFAGDVSIAEMAVPPDVGRYRARRSEACVAGGDIELVKLHGAGRIVALSTRLRAEGASTLAYLEGDERIVVDGARAPWWHGTGVEDLYSGGFYFDQGAFAGPLGGATRVDPDGSGTSAAHRIMATDAPVWSSALRMTLEAGLSPTEPVPMCAQHVVHAYVRERATSVPRGGFDVGTPAALSHDYAPPPGAVCEARTGRFSDEPPTLRSATVCRFAAGTSRFTFTLREPAQGLRLRRTIDVAAGEPGRIAGAPAALVRIDGVEVGRFPPAAANPARRWDEQEILLAGQYDAGELAFDIMPEHGVHAAMHSESSWSLYSAWIDTIHRDGFDGEERR